MRILGAGILVALLAVPAFAAGEMETVTIGSDQVMSGVWRIPAPTEVLIGTDGTKFGAFHDAYCRVSQRNGDLSANCLGDGFRRDGEGEIENGAIHLAWGNFLVRFVVNAQLKSPARFDGTFGIKLSGVEMTDPDPVSATKLTPSLDAPDGDGLAGKLRNAISEMAAGGLSMPHDEAAITKSAGGVPLPAPGKLRALGDIQALYFLGRTKPSGGKPADGEEMSVYSVEFANGERLCALHQREDGVLDALQCA